MLFAFVFGGAAYVLIELLYRGRSHISMAFAGGIYFLLLHLLFTYRPKMGLIEKCAAGFIIITAVEFLFGLAVNIALKLKVWDYSNQRFNLFGQVCLKYSLCWAALTVPIAYISKLLRAFFA